MEKPIFDGPLLKISSSCFQLNAPFLQNTGLYTRMFENAAIFIRVVVVLRPRAISRTVTACTCADVIQPCPLHLLLNRNAWGGGSKTVQLFKMADELESSFSQFSPIQVPLFLILLWNKVFWKAKLRIVVKKQLTLNAKVLMVNGENH